SVASVARIVITKSTICSGPIAKVSLKTLGEARRKPVITNIAARAAIGIRSITDDATSTKAKIKKPWKKLDQRVRAPAAILAVDLTISEIIGKPPINPETALPSPTAAMSLLRFDLRLKGSNLSMAAQLSSVSTPCTKVIESTESQNGIVAALLKS